MLRRSPVAGDWKSYWLPSAEQGPGGSAGRLRTPQVRAAARAIVAVELAARIDANPDRHLGPHRLQVVVVQLRAQHEVARASANWLSLALDMPVDLALHHHPPLVVLVVVGVVGHAWRMNDHKRLNVVAEDQRLNPGHVFGTIGEHLVEARVKFAGIENRKSDGHANESTAPLKGGQAAPCAGTETGLAWRVPARRSGPVRRSHCQRSRAATPPAQLVWLPALRAHRNSRLTARSQD